jgi:hypothetical protein
MVAGPIGRWSDTYTLEAVPSNHYLELYPLAMTRRPRRRYCTLWRHDTDGLEGLAGWHLVRTLLGCRLHILGVAGSWRFNEWRRRMRKKFARMANLIREIAVFLIPILSAIDLMMKLVNKVANCNAAQLRIEV